MIDMVVDPHMLIVLLIGKIRMGILLSEWNLTTRLFHLIHGKNLKLGAINMNLNVFMIKNFYPFIMQMVLK